jgi:hypothetical protein
MNIWLIPLEKIETRYTYEWYSHIPHMVCSYCKENDLHFRYVEFDSRHTEKFEDEVLMINVAGEMPQQTASAGAFINFASTNVWKSSQGQKIAQAFTEGLVKAGDKFYFTDAWNPTIIQVRYMSDLLGIPVQIIGQWHAGWHDPNDFLGRTINDPRWVERFEASLYYAIDKNLFTTDAYINMFRSRLRQFVPIPEYDYKERTVRVGYPNSYLQTKLVPYKAVPKERIVLFPHRIAPEKQLDIFKDLEKEFSTLEGFTDVKFIVCQEQQLTKPQYHELLGRSRVVFSAALQETYGIAQTEAVFAGALPLSPDRLSYSEMYIPEFLYPSVWTESFEEYTKFKNLLIQYLCDMLWNDGYFTLLEDQEEKLVNEYIGDKGICELLTNRGSH